MRKKFKKKLVGTLEANVRQALVSEIELGEANPTVRTIAKLAHALDVDPVDLFSEA